MTFANRIFTRRNDMPEITRDQVKVPADVSADARETYIDN